MEKFSPTCESAEVHCFGSDYEKIAAVIDPVIFLETIKANNLLGIEDLLINDIKRGFVTSTNVDSYLARISELKVRLCDEELFCYFLGHEEFHTRRVFVDLDEDDYLSVLDVIDMVRTYPDLSLSLHDNLILFFICDFRLIKTEYGTPVNFIEHCKQFSMEVLHEAYMDSKYAGYGVTLYSIYLPDLNELFVQFGHEFLGKKYSSLRRLLIELITDKPKEYELALFLLKKYFNEPDQKLYNPSEVFVFSKEIDGLRWRGLKEEDVERVIEAVKSYPWATLLVCRYFFEQYQNIAEIVDPVDFLGMIEESGAAGYEHFVFMQVEAGTLSKTNYIAYFDLLRVVTKASNQDKTLLGTLFEYLIDSFPAIATVSSPERNCLVAKAIAEIYQDSSVDDCDKFETALHYIADVETVMELFSNPQEFGDYLKKQNTRLVRANIDFLYEQHDVGTYQDFYLKLTKLFEECGETVKNGILTDYSENSILRKLAQWASNTPKEFTAFMDHYIEAYNNDDIEFVPSPDFPTLVPLYMKVVAEIAKMEYYGFYEKYAVVDSADLMVLYQNGGLAEVGVTYQDLAVLNYINYLYYDIFNVEDFNITEAQLEEVVEVLYFKIRRIKWFPLSVVKSKEIYFKLKKSLEYLAGSVLLQQDRIQEVYLPIRWDYVMAGIRAYEDEKLPDKDLLIEIEGLSKEYEIIDPGKSCELKLLKRILEFAEEVRDKGEVNSETLPLLQETNPSTVTAIVGISILIAKAQIEKLQLPAQLAETMDENDYFENILQKVHDLVQVEREKYKDLMPIGGKIHAKRGFSYQSISLMANVFGLKSTPFRLIHANQSLVLDLFKTPLEMQLFIMVLDKLGVLNENDPQLQLAIGCRLPNSLAMILGSSILLGTRRSAKFAPGAFSTTDNRKTDARIMAYDAGVRRGTANDIEGVVGRTDMLCLRDLGDVSNYHLVGNLLVNGYLEGPLVDLCAKYNREFWKIMDDFGLSGTITSSHWLKSQDLPETDDSSSHELMVNKVVQAWLDSSYYPNLGPHGKIVDLIARTREELLNSEQLSLPNDF